jgi:hypothetical protein
LHNNLAFRVLAETARPRVPHVRTVALKVLVHRIGLSSIPVISIHDWKLQQSATALVIEETVLDDPAIDVPLCAPAFL